MADKRCDIMDKAEGKKKRICDSGCKYWSFPHLDTACVLSGVYSVKKGQGCYIYSEKPIKVEGLNE